MQVETENDPVTRMDFTLRIITGAITLGFFVATLILGFLIARPAQPQAQAQAQAGAAQAQAQAGGQAEKTPIVTYIAAFVAFSGLSAAFTIPKVIEATGRRGFAESLGELSKDVSKVSVEKAGTLLAAHQTAVIVKAALIEGPGFFLLIAYFLEGERIALYGAVCMMLLLASLIPRSGSTRAWLDQQIELARVERLAA